MSFCVVVEVAGPCRWPKYENSGRFKRVLFLWFSVSFFPYKWTEFLHKYRLAIEKMNE